jgi:16S rRNA processing protein RimM
LPEQRVLMGVIGRPHGLRGLVHVHSYTADPADLPAYGPLDDGRGRRFTLRWTGEGIAEIAEIVDGKPVPVRDRTLAEKLVNVRLYVDRDRLPSAEEDEYYLADLVGLPAFGPDGADLGKVDAVHDFGGGPFLEIGRLAVPFTRACVPEVDLAAGRLTVVPPVETEAE